MLCTMTEVMYCNDCCLTKILKTCNEKHLFKVSLGTVGFGWLLLCGVCGIVTAHIHRVFGYV